MTDSSQDEFMLGLEDEFGLHGYAWWWKTLEAIAAQMSHYEGSEKCSLASPWSNWQSILRGKRKKLKTFFDHCENKNKIKQEENGNILKITCSKLLEIKDNHQKDLEAASKRLPSKEVEGRGKKEERIYKPREQKNPVCENEKSVRKNFEEDWGIYKRKAGNKEVAFLAYSKSVGNNPEKRKKLLRAQKAQNKARPNVRYMVSGEKFFKEWENLVFEPMDYNDGNNRLPGGLVF